MSLEFQHLTNLEQVRKYGMICKFCKHKWKPKIESGIPSRCPKCKTYTDKKITDTATKYINFTTHKKCRPCNIWYKKSQKINRCPLCHTLLANRPRNTSKKYLVNKTRAEKMDKKRI